MRECLPVGILDLDDLDRAPARGALEGPRGDSAPEADEEESPLRPSEEDAGDLAEERLGRHVGEAPPGGVQGDAALDLAVPAHVDGVRGGVELDGNDDIASLLEGDDLA